MMQPEHDQENNSTNDLEKRWEVQSTFVERDPSKDEVNTKPADSPFTKWANAGFPHDMFDLEEDDIVAITNVWKSPIKSPVKDSSSESVNDNCPSPSKQTPDEVDDDNNMLDSKLRSSLLPTAVNGGSQEQSVARDGFNESPEIQDYGIAWVSDDAWPKSKIFKRAKNYRCCKKIDLKNGGTNVHGTKPYDRTSTTASIKLPKTSIIWPIEDSKSRSLNEKSQSFTSTYSGQERTEVGPPLKRDSLRIESAANKNQTSSMNHEPCIVGFDNRANEQSLGKKTEADKNSNMERESHNTLNTPSSSVICNVSTSEKKPSLSPSPTSQRLVICEESELSSSSSESTEGSPKENRPSYEDETGKVKKLTRKHKRKRSPPGHPQTLSSGSFQSDVYNQGSSSNTLNLTINSSVSNQSSTSYSCHENKPINVSSSSENMSEIPEYSISEPYSRVTSSGTINLRISSEYFSDSSSSYMSSPSDTSPVLMSRNPTNQQVMEEGSENSHTSGDVHLLNKNIEELRSKYEEQIASQKNKTHQEIDYVPLTSPILMSRIPTNHQVMEEESENFHTSGHVHLLNKNIEELRSKYEEQIASQKNETHQEIGYVSLTIPHYNCHESDNSQYVDWSPGEYHNSYYCYQTSPEYNPRADFSIVKGDSQQNRPVIESSQGFLPLNLRSNSSPENPKSKVGKNNDSTSKNTFTDSSSSSEGSYDSTDVYSPNLSYANGPYYHDKDPLGLCQPSPGNSAGRDQVTKQDDVKWPDTPRPEYYYPRPGFYSFWEGPRRSQSSPITPTLNFNISEYESGRRQFLTSPEFYQQPTSPINGTTSSVDDALLTEEDIRREIYNLVESIAFIKHKETVLLDAVEELERERWVLEGRLSALIEKPLENGNSHKEDYD